MSVVVRMELPDCCDDCPMEYDGFMCRAIHTHFYPKRDGCYLDPLIDTSKERLPDCPIICSLPECHGRLVDADKEIDFHVNDFERVKTEGIDVYSRVYSLSDLCDGIIYAYDRADTIVPAETSKEDV